MNAFLEIPVLPPRSIVLSPPLSDDEFERMSMQCDNASLERSKEGAIIVNPPTGILTSDGNSEIIHQLRGWWKQHRRGRAFDSNAGFFLPDGSVLSPDAAYVTADQLEGLTRAQLARLPRLAPAFVIELLSDSDRLTEAVANMESWMANGVKLGWLVDPYANQVRIYEAGAQPRIETGNAVTGFGPVQGFVLDATEVWRCYE
ncbi:MAG TPA: Uma2 family endonuclease [Terracidiphilus sp.]|nr:Uma2 family endonuclease [Terracidiphilus sp.]